MIFIQPSYKILSASLHYRFTASLLIHNSYGRTRRKHLHSSLGLHTAVSLQSKNCPFSVSLFLINFKLVGELQSKLTKCRLLCGIVGKTLESSNQGSAHHLSSMRSRSFYEPYAVTYVRVRSLKKSYR